LRFLQEHEVDRVGGRSPIHVDARVLAATNVDLAKAMGKDASVRPVLSSWRSHDFDATPAEPGGDILLLANAFLQRNSATRDKKLIFTPKAVAALEAHSWSGNIRELENRIQRAAIMAENGRITPKDLAISQYAGYEGQGLNKARQAVEREMVEAALARNKGNLTRAAADWKSADPPL